jgi:hypothetical protein
MKKIILLIIGFLLFNTCCSPKIIGVDNAIRETNSIIENNEVRQLFVFECVAFNSMLCIDYSDAKFGEYDEIIDYNLQGKIQLTEENVRKMFLGCKNTVEIISYEDGKVVDKITTEEYLKGKAFYLTHIVLSNKKWTAIIIEEIDYEPTYTQSDKYLVTIDKKQNLISKYRIAFYGKFGTYTCDCVEMEYEDEDGNIITEKDEDGNIIESCGRCPWFTGADGCIDKDLTIGVDAGQFYSSKAFIDKEGNIVKIIK